MLLPPPTRPQSYLELVSRSLNLSRHAFLRCIGLSLLLSLVAFFPRLLCLAVGRNVYMVALPQHPIQILYGVVIYLCTLWFLGAVFWRIYCVAIGKKESYVDDFRTAMKKIAYLVGAGLMLLALGIFMLILIYQFHLLTNYNDLLQQSIPKILGMTLLIFIEALLPFYLSILFILYFPLIVIENDRIFRAFKESAILVYGNVLRTFFFLVTPWIGYVLIIAFLRNSLNFNIHLYFTPLDPVPDILPTLLQILIFSVFVIWGASAFLVQLWDLELRKSRSKAL